MYNISLSIKSEPEYVSLIAAAIRGLGAFFELSKQDIEAIVLGSVEAVNNCIEHAYDNQTNQVIHLDFSYDENQIKIEITDRGNPMIESPDFDLPNLDSDSGGRGWFIINACFDEINYNTENGINTISLSKLAKQPR